LNEIAPAAAELLTINDKFFVRFRGCSNTAEAVSKTRGPICTKLGAYIVRSSLHTKFEMVKISRSVSKPQRLKVKRWSAIRPKIALFDPLYDRTSGIHLLAGLAAAAERRVPVK